MAGNTFLPELHLIQPGCIDSTSKPFTKYRKRIQKFKEKGDLKYIYKKELDKVCFAHDASYCDSKDLETTLDNILRNGAY